MGSMRAIIRHDYGTPDVLELEQIERPTIGDDGVLIRVHAASVNPLDCHLLIGKPYLVRLMGGMPKPKRAILGVDVSGTVEAVGRNVTRFRPGDEVFGGAGAIGGGSGSLAEYARTGEDALVAKPKQVPFEQAAATPLAGLTAIQALRAGNLQAGQRALINGAAGGVGTFAVQIAKSFGADVTGVCSTASVELVRSIGADHVVDYMSEDFVRGDRRYDVMIDNVGNRSLSDCRRVLNPHGIYVMVSVPKKGLEPIIRILGATLAFMGSQRAVPMVTRRSNADLLALSELLVTGKITPVIERTYGLAETREAFRHLGRGHARGKIVITILSSSVSTK